MLHEVHHHVKFAFLFIIWKILLTFMPSVNLEAKAKPLTGVGVGRAFWVDELGTLPSPAGGGAPAGPVSRSGGWV